MRDKRDKSEDYLLGEVIEENGEIGQYYFAPVGYIEYCFLSEIHITKLEYSLRCMEVALEYGMPILR